MDELENIPGFNAFTDFMQSFNLLRGKKTDDEDDEVRRFSGKFKVTFLCMLKYLVKGNLTKI